MDKERFAVRLACELRARCGDHPNIFEAVKWAVEHSDIPAERGQRWSLAVQRLADDIEDYVGTHGIALDPFLTHERPSPWRALVQNAVLRAGE